MPNAAEKKERETMTTKKQLRTMLEGEKTEKEIALEGLADAVKQNTEAEKLANHLRETIRSLTERLENAESINRTLGATITEIGKQNNCTGCAHIDANDKKLRPQKCACCRRGAKDNYVEATP
jgi:uncharacterized coiled-coil protein SlyX